MSHGIPDYLYRAPSELGQGHSVRVRILGDPAALADDMAQAMAACLRQAQAEGRGATLIVPVGPVDQYPVFARLVNEERLSLKDTVFVNMDEYLTDDDHWLPLDHPLSFRGFMNRQFYDLLDPELVPPPENRIFPDPRAPQAIGERLEERGGVDACFGGIGINGHVAFNEPPEPDETCSVANFAALPTRVLSLARETRTINSVTVGGDLTMIPRRCVTVGMKEILAARQLCFYCNRPWQAGVVRRVLHGPLTAACPASLLRTHHAASLTITECVAAAPVIQLR